MAKPSGGSPAVGVIVAVLIIGAVASIGFFQFSVAPSIFTSTSTTTTTATTAAGCQPGKCVNVTIPTGASTTPPGFAPDTVTVVLGVNSTVMWTNSDTTGIPHTVTAKDGSWGSPTMNQGDTYIHTFTAAGTYPYYCTFHPSVMTGTVIVKP